MKISSKNSIILWKLNAANEIKELVVVKRRDSLMPVYREFECSSGCCRDDWKPDNEAVLMIHVIRILVLYGFENASVKKAALQELAKITQLRKFRTLIESIEGEI